MSKQENFNDILRSKFTERETPVNEEDWRKMRNTIDESRKRKRRILWISLSTAALLLGFGVYEYVIIQPVSKDNLVSINPKPVATATNNAPDLKNVTTNKPQASVPIVNEDKGTSKDLVDNSKPSTVNKSSVSKTQPIVASAANKQKASAEITASVVNRNSVAITKRQRHSTETAQVDVLPSTTSKSTITSVKSSSQPIKKVDHLSESQTESSSATVTSVSSNSGNENQPVNNTAIVNPANSAATEVTKKQDTLAKNQVVAEVTKNNSTASESYSSNKKSDSIPPKVASESAVPLPPIEGKKPKKNNFSIEAGAGYSLGWNYSDTVQGRGINPTIGIGYTRTLNDKFALKTGLQLSCIGNMGTSPFIIKHVNYDFGYNSNDTSLKTNWLFYLTIPVQIEYKLGENNAIGLGGTISYLLSGYGDVNVYNIADNTTHAVNTYSQFMYVKGFNQWNASVFLLYKRTLFGKLSAYLIPYFGLMNIKNNAFFSQNKLERDSGLKLILSYTIL